MEIITVDLLKRIMKKDCIFLLYRRNVKILVKTIPHRNTGQDEINVIAYTKWTHWNMNKVKAHPAQITNVQGRALVWLRLGAMAQVMALPHP